MKSELVGIDKLVTYSRDFKLDARHNFTIVQHHEQGKELPVLYKYKNGNEIRANKMYYNGKLANYTINGYGLKVDFNPNKIIHNYKNANLSKLHDVFGSIAGEAEDNGLPDVSLSNFLITRIDVCRQSEMDGMFQSYQPLFAMMKANRKLTRDYGTTYNIGNKSTGLVMYDKGKELIDKRGISIPEKNLMRGEIQFKNSKSVKSKLPFCQISQLMKFDNGDILEIYRDNMKKYTGDSERIIQMGTSLQQEIDIMNTFYQSGKKFWLEEYLLSNLDVGEVLSDKFNGYSNMIAAFDYIGLNKHQKSRAKTKLDDYLKASRIESENNINKLYNEFYQKFAS